MSIAGGKNLKASITKSGRGLPVTSSASPAPDHDAWRAEDDHRTLMRGEEIRSDHQRMRGVKQIHRRETGRMQKLGRALGKSKGRRRAAGKSR